MYQSIVSKQVHTQTDDNVMHPDAILIIVLQYILQLEINKEFTQKEIDIYTEFIMSSVLVIDYVP